MVNGFFDELEKIGSALAHGTELAGLGILARPSIRKLQGKKQSEKSTHVHEAVGLGVLAAPSAIHLAKQGLGALRKIKKSSVGPLPAMLRGRAAHIVHNGGKAVAKAATETKKPQFTMAHLREAQAKMGIKPPPGIR